jgi:hypothetical protein
MRLHSAALALMVGCTGGGDTGGKSSVALGEEADGFALPDVNPNSASYNSDVSVGDFEGRVSAWYFAHAT